MVVFFLAAATLFTACSDDDDGTPVIEPTGSLMVEDQALVNGMITVSEVELSNDGWLVIYNDNNAVLGTEILGYTHVEAGTHDDVTVELEDDVEITSGDILWAALHIDDDEDGIFDWDGVTGIDVPIRSGVVTIAESFTVTTDSGETNAVTAEDQAVADGSITIDNVFLEEAGWVVVHNDADDAPGEVIGVSEVLAAGSHDDVVVTFEETAEVNVGDVLWIMLHSDTGVAGDYEYDGVNGLDEPILGDDNNPVMTSITIVE